MSLDDLLEMNNETFKTIKDIHLSMAPSLMLFGSSETSANALSDIILFNTAEILRNIQHDPR